MGTVIQRRLSGGELSPSLHQGVDLARYATSLRTMRNCIVKKGGGATNRAGSQYVYGAPNTSITYDDVGPEIGANTILVPWESPSSSTSYVLEFGNGFIRFYRDGDVVTVDNVQDWNNATAYVIGDLVCYEGVNYYCIAAHTGQQPPNALYWHDLYGYEYSIPSPYTSGLLLDRGEFYFTQDADRLIIVHGSVIPYELTRSSETNWVLTAWETSSSKFGVPRINAPTNVQAVTASTDPNTAWAVTALTTDLEESLPATVTGPNSNTTNDVVLSWTASTFTSSASGTIKGYRVYKLFGGIFYYLGFTTSTGYTDDATITPSPDGDSPPELRTELVNSAAGFPSKIGTFEGRTLLGRFAFNVQAVYGSRIGYRQNFTRSYPSGADDSILFQIRGKQISGIRHFADIGSLIVFTDTGEWLIEPGSSGALTPTACFPRQYSANGAVGSVRPIVINSTAIYVQAQGSIVRALGFDSYAGGKNGYRDDDLTIFADHLFEGYTIVSMDYQKNPHPILWCVRSDGVLLGLTYNREQEILAWHRHDTDGTVEDVCCIPEGTEYATYIVVKRSINGSDVRYLERLSQRNFADIVDAIFLDSALSFDGRNTGTQTLTLSGGSTWNENEELTLESSIPFFSSDEIGNEIWFTGTDDAVYRVEITGYDELAGDRFCTVRPLHDIAAGVGIRDTATTSWARAVDTVSGLDHLEAKEVSVFADGYVIANPNNSDYGTALTVSSGSITLPECHAVIHVGLPYLSDLETLDIDTVNGETLVDKKSCVSKVTMHVHESRGIWVGAAPPTDDATDPLEGLAELKVREAEPYAEPIDLLTGKAEVIIQPEWSSNGRIFIRQVDPLPFTILSIAPAGLSPFRGGA